MKPICEAIGIHPRKHETLRFDKCKHISEKPVHQRMLPPGQRPFPESGRGKKEEEREGGVGGRSRASRANRQHVVLSIKLTNVRKLPVEKHMPFQTPMNTHQNSSNASNLNEVLLNENPLAYHRSATWFSSPILGSPFLKAHFTEESFSAKKLVNPGRMQARAGVLRAEGRGEGLPLIRPCARV
ncbi:hypothetical protein CDAR_424991 [Caerostris darwini]|uniref:Uncharacterized protein n=1 Tax=Caerostris darwini TaxID=1538125 RepID=A0AAV4RUQ9_9ARAC|nr:hypothetical protein CDAR_424991 [Caerostris darwini]